MQSPLKRRAQDDLVSPRRKFRPCKIPRPQFFIHEASSTYESLVNALPPTSEQSFLTEDKENVNPNPFEPRPDADGRRSGRTPLQAHPDTGTHAEEQYIADTGSNPAECYSPLQEWISTKVNVGNEDSGTAKNEDCWVTHDGELYTIVTGPLARSFGDEWKTFKGLQFKDEIFPSLGILEPTSRDTPSLTSIPPRRKAGPVGTASRPPSSQFQDSAGDQWALGVIQKWVNK